MVLIKSILKYRGIYEWLLVRFSAVLMLLYITYIFTFIIFINTVISYDKWYDFFSKNTTKTFSSMALLAALNHTWIGMRHILEDYIKLSKLKQLGIWVTGTILLIYLSCGIIIIWSI